jgi:flagellar hook-length control protein FliK
MTTPVTGFPLEMFPANATAPAMSGAATSKDTQDSPPDFLDALLGSLFGENGGPGNVVSGAAANPAPAPGIVPGVAVEENEQTPDSEDAAAVVTQLPLPIFQFQEPVVEPKTKDLSGDPQSDLIDAIMYPSGGNAPVLALAWLPSPNDTGAAAEIISDADSGAGSPQATALQAKWEAASAPQLDWVRSSADFKAALDGTLGPTQAAQAAVTSASANPAEIPAAAEQNLSPKVPIVEISGLQSAKEMAPATVAEESVGATGKGEQPAWGAPARKTGLADRRESSGTMPRPDLAADAQDPAETTHAAKAASPSTSSAKEIALEPVRRVSSTAGTERDAQPDALARMLSSPSQAQGGKDLPATQAPQRAPRQQEFLFQLADKIQVQVQNGGGEIRIQLRPENLGRMEITAETGAQGMVARIVTESAGVKQYLENNLHVLQQSLADNGLKVDRIDFIVQDGLDSRLFNGNQQQSQAGAGQHASDSGTRFSGGSTLRGGTRHEEIALDAASLMAIRPNSTFYTIA